MKFTKYRVLFALLGLVLASCGKADDPVVEPPDEPAIGKSYAGGIVFYLDYTGKHGLAVASNDEQYASSWGCEGTWLSANGATVGAGPQNTTTVVNGCGTPDIAARLCDNNSSGGFNDWYMPSKDELNMIYNNLYRNGMGGLNGGFYWSSTEADSARAWFQYFKSGLQNPYNKHFQFYVRAIRAF